MASLSEINQKIIGGVTGTLTKSAFINAIGWLVLGLVVIGVSGAIAWWYFDKKKYNKKVFAHGIVHGYFYKTYQDIAKSVKVGKGGFEIIYLKKLKTWKLAHYARSGVNEYHFYILPDGYWYPGQVSADLKTMDKNKGLISVITTNPSMRAQYTSLEKQIDDIHKKKETWWEKHGMIIMNLAYILIIGVFVWLTFREVSQFLGSGSLLADKMNELADSMNRIAINLNNACQGGGGLAQ